MTTETKLVTPGTDGNAHLSRVLKPIHLWALAVGLVISGNYFGWSYGFGAGGPMGLALALIPVTIFYVTFILSYSELATAIPHAGGPSAYARRAMGPFWGYMNGISCLIEFVFAPPAIALAVGGYINFLVPSVPTLTAAVAAFLFFIFVNYLGMKTSATVELVVTIIALVGLVIFWVAAAPHFSMTRVMAEPLLPFGMKGVMAAVPFAIWFYLAIEGGAMAAEEMVNPQKDIPKGFLSGMGTLMIMGFLTLFLTAGIADYNLVSAVDFPLPIALAQVFGENAFIVVLVNIIGLFGLIASLHGIIVGYSRQTYAMARTGYLPKFLAYVDPKRHTPVWALLVPGLVGLGVVLTGQTAIVITIAVIGSVALYMLSLISLFILRSKEPNLKRPFKVSYPIVPVISFITGIFLTISVLVSSIPALKWTALVYFIAIAYYFVWGNKNIRPFEEEFGVLDELDA
ncbi:ethanolamine permease [Desulfosporosinus sp. BICA1-9]|uniref:ethanolamine permease n=1 Tax=Desulfosporosinus sp. BICA1-9 TaxID=1531958 RepID=UPI00054C66E7|nr:ethanolamine permease [Desulfosporosinus sp. BICA1-9]KJS81210.1 MAG: ethanolamin permease [Desulfosporosinus sp. BICA1-9]HBW37517.1 ethanolamine permease [Desulfosporosinus sp.]